MHAKDVLMDESVDLDEIALATSGAVGSDLANMINEAAINAVKMGREFVSQKDLLMLVACSISLAAPVVTVSKTISSAARPPKRPTNLSLSPTGN